MEVKSKAWATTYTCDQELVVCPTNSPSHSMWQDSILSTPIQQMLSSPKSRLAVTLQIAHQFSECFHYKTQHSVSNTVSIKYSATISYAATLWNIWHSAFLCHPALYNASISETMACHHFYDKKIRWPLKIFWGSNSLHTHTHTI